jgi:hypothetical protein
MWIKVNLADWNEDPEKYRAQVTPDDSIKVLNDDGSCALVEHYDASKQGSAVEAVATAEE